MVKKSILDWDQWENVWGGRNGKNGKFRNCATLNNNKVFENAKMQIWSKMQEYNKLPIWS